MENDPDELLPTKQLARRYNKDELHIRLAAIAEHYQVTFEELIACRTRD
jgi:hypothetical protein